MSTTPYPINGSIGEAAPGSIPDISSAGATTHIEHQLSSPMDIGRAHQFFQPQPINMIGHAAIAPGSDLSSLTAKALACAQQQISPIIQLIMRMPGHIGVMSSAFEAFSNFFLPHSDLLGNFDHNILAAHVDAGQHLDPTITASEHAPIDLTLLPHDAPILHDVSFNGSELGPSLGEHNFDLSYVNDHLLPGGELNVAGTLDPAKSQFEGISFSDPHGELISGPSLSQANPATHLAFGQRLLLDKGFMQATSQATSMNSVAGAGMNSAVAGGAASPSISSTMSQTLPLSPSASSLANSLPNTLNVSANTLGQQSTALPDAANVASTDASTSMASSGNLNAVTSNSSESSSFGPSGAVTNKLGSQQILAENKITAADSTGKPALSSATTGAGGNEYGANYLKDQPSGDLANASGLKAKQLTLDSLKSTKVASATSPSAAAKQVSDSIKRHATLNHAPSKPSAATSSITPKSAVEKAPQSNTDSNTEKVADGSSAANDATKAGADQATTSYTIRSGDCLWNIAKDHLGNAMKWQDVYKLNSQTIGANPDLIRPGATLQIPGSEHLVAQAGDATKYVVRPGDNLWDIAKTHLGDGTKWGDLYKLNHDVIGTNPDLIQPGQELALGQPQPGADGATMADASTSAPGADQVAQATPAAHDAPTEFGQPANSSPADAGNVAQQVPTEQAIPQQPDAALPQSGAATAAPAAQPPAMSTPQMQAAPAAAAQAPMPGPGAAGAATLPDVSTSAVSASSPDKSSLVSSSVMTSLQDFLGRKK